MSDDDDRGVSISPRALIQVAAIATAAALGGGGVSFASSPRAELAALKSSVDTVAIAVVEIKTELRADRATVARMQADIADLEERVRALERATR